MPVCYAEPRDSECFGLPLGWCSARFTRRAGGVNADSVVVVVTATIPCAYCGVDTVATCPSCRNRVCNRHMIVSVRGISEFEGFNTFTASRAVLYHPVGQTELREPVTRAFAEGPPRCQRCRSQDSVAADDLREQAEREAQAERIAQTERVLSVLRSSGDPDALAAAVRTAPDSTRLSESEAARVWRLIVKSERFVPHFDVIALRDRWPRRLPEISGSPVRAYGWQTTKHDFRDGEEYGDSTVHLITENGEYMTAYPFRCSRGPFIGSGRYVVRSGDRVRRREGAAGVAVLASQTSAPKPVKLSHLRQFLASGNPHPSAVFSEPPGPFQDELMR